MEVDGRTFDFNLISLFLCSAPVVSWYRNNQLVKPSKYFQMSSTTEGLHTLSIMEAFPEDTGTYKCVARNKAGEVFCLTFLKVHGKQSAGSNSNVR
jgi:hypothetical protein